MSAASTCSTARRCSISSPTSRMSPRKSSAVAGWRKPRRARRGETSTPGGRGGDAPPPRPGEGGGQGSGEDKPPPPGGERGVGDETPPPSRVATTHHLPLPPGGGPAPPGE